MLKSISEVSFSRNLTNYSKARSHLGIQARDPCAKRNLTTLDQDESKLVKLSLKCSRIILNVTHEWTNNNEARSNQFLGNFPCIEQVRCTRIVPQPQGWQDDASRVLRTHLSKVLTHELYLRGAFRVRAPLPSSRLQSPPLPSRRRSHRRSTWTWRASSCASSSACASASCATWLSSLGSRSGSQRN